MFPSAPYETMGRLFGTYSIVFVFFLGPTFVGPDFDPVSAVFFGVVV